MHAKANIEQIFPSIKRRCRGREKGEKRERERGGALREMEEDFVTQKSSPQTIIMHEDDTLSIIE